jgi:hypothetical protein
METLSARALTSQLAEDLAWLEQHCRLNPEHSRAAAQLRLAAALVRNCIGPALDGHAPAPLHVAVIGGAGAGKSTVANLLSGGSAAEANAQAGFTRHPIAYTPQNGPVTWNGFLGFLGPLHLLTQPSPSSLDEDVYQVRRVSGDPHSLELLQGYVVWDCPDMTTWAATGYLPRLIEAAALADIIVYVASDERYNDEVPTQLVHLLLQAGKPVVACLMKMREADAPALLAHFQQEVVAHLPPGVVATLAIPFLSREQLADPAREAARYRIPLLNQVAVLGSPPERARQRSIEGGVSYLLRTQDHLLTVARHDLAALEAWQAVVTSGQIDFDQRYQREYLTSEKFRGFDEALVRLMELLELPGIGRVLSGALYIVRTPFRLIKELVTKAISRPEGATRPEQRILEEALAGWIDLLRKEAVRRADEHPLWRHVSEAFATGGLAERIREQFQQYFRSFQTNLSAEVDQTARSIYEELEKKPAVLNTLRGGKFALDAAAVGGTLAAGGINWHDLILVPLAAAMTHQLVEMLGKQVVDVQREQTRQRQQALMAQLISVPLRDWLTQWPATGGSSFERLQLALRRIPQHIRELAARVRTPQGGGRP